MEKMQQKRHSSKNKTNQRKFRFDAAEDNSESDLFDSLLASSTSESDKTNILPKSKLRTKCSLESNVEPSRHDIKPNIRQRNASWSPSNSTETKSQLPLKSILSEGRGRKTSLDEKLLSFGGNAVNVARRSLSGPSDRTLSSDIADSTEQESTPRPSRRKSKAEPLKAFVRFAEAAPLHFLQPNASVQNFFQQRASFQSEAVALSKYSSGPGCLSKQSSGIVCSNNDLRLILCDANNQRRYSVEAKRELMKNNRSLSFDSSSFRYRKTFQSGGFLSRIPNNGSSSPAQCTSLEGSPRIGRNMIEIRVVSDHPEETEPTKVDETNDTVLQEKDESDELLQADDQCQVPWDGKSVVDATILGSAIETYLTSPSRRVSTEPLLHTSQNTTDISVQESSICSTLKSLFVK